MTHREHPIEFEPVPQQRNSREQGWHDVLALLAEHGFEGFAGAVQILMNEAMKLEREMALGAQPYERTPSRRGYANGFKPKTVETRLGSLELAVPQTRGVEFYPSALERGTRSERALKLAITTPPDWVICPSSGCWSRAEQELTPGTTRGRRRWNTVRLDSAPRPRSDSFSRRLAERRDLKAISTSHAVDPVKRTAEVSRLEKLPISDTGPRGLS